MHYIPPLTPLTERCQKCGKYKLGGFIGEEYYTFVFSDGEYPVCFSCLEDFGNKYGYNNETEENVKEWLGEK